MSFRKQFVKNLAVTGTALAVGAAIIGVAIAATWLHPIAGPILWMGSLMIGFCAWNAWQDRHLEEPGQGDSKPEKLNGHVRKEGGFRPINGVSFQDGKGESENG